MLFEHLDPLGTVCTHACKDNAEDLLVIRMAKGLVHKICTRLEAADRRFVIEAYHRATASVLADLHMLAAGCNVDPASPQYLLILCLLDMDGTCLIQSSGKRIRKSCRHMLYQNQRHRKICRKHRNQYLQCLRTSCRTSQSDQGILPHTGRCCGRILVHIPVHCRIYGAIQFLRYALDHLPYTLGSLIRIHRLCMLWCRQTTGCIVQ